MSSSRIILGLDPGLARLGWGVIIQNPSVLKNSQRNLELIEYGVIETKSKDKLDLRLVSIYETLNLIIKKYKPNAVGLEKLFFGKNAKTAMSVGEARGVTILSLAQNKLTFSEFSPAEVKIALTGYGNADKKQMQEMVKRTLKIDKIPKPDDAADALAIAITTAVTHKFI